MGAYGDIFGPLTQLEGLKDTEPPDGAALSVRQAIQALTTIPDDTRDIRVYPLRPAGAIELPALWNYIPDGEHEIIATGMAEERPLINVRIGIRHTTNDQDLLVLLAYIDAFIDVVDPFLLWHSEQLGSQMQEIVRGGVRNRQDKFGEVPVLCAEFPIRARIRQPITNA